MDIVSRWNRLSFRSEPHCPRVRWHADVQPDDLILESFCMGGISCNVLTGLEGPASGLQADEGHFLKAGFVYFGKNPASCF